MKDKLKWISMLLLAAILSVVLVSTPSVQADAAPPAPPPGQSLQPGEELTMVQMNAEEVIIEVYDNLVTIDPSVPFDPTYVHPMTGYNVEIEATFWMQNMGSQEEQLEVRFPLSAQDGWGNQFSIFDLKIEVDGNRVEWRQGETPDNDYNYLWAYFDVTFPPGQAVNINVKYKTLSMSYQNIQYEHLEYILETGAGWYDAIRSGTIILRLPYDATPENVLLNEYSFPGGEFVGGEVHWNFKDLEPDYEDNWRLEIISPGVWKSIIANRAALASNPDDLAALQALGQACLDASVSIKHYYVEGSFDLFKEGKAATSKAVSLSPDDVDLRILYAYTMLAELNTEELRTTESLALTQEQFEYLRANAPASEELEELEYMYEWMLEWLPDDLPEPTEDVAPTEEPTQEPPVPTEEPTVEPTTWYEQAPTNEPRGGLRLCPGTVYLGAGFLFIVIGGSIARRKKKRE